MAKNDLANETLTERGPNASAGSSVGEPDPDLGGSLKVAPSASPEPPAAAPEPSRASLLGLPDQLPETWCTTCKADVLPRGKGLCPRCGRFLRQHFVSRKHPVNALRREVILNKLIADYSPQTTLLHASCEHLASILEQLENLKPGGADHQRLVQLSQLLGAQLEESRTARPSLPTDYATLTDDAMIDKCTAMLRHLLALRESRMPTLDPADAYVIDVDEDDAVPEASTVPTRPTDPCPYGCGSLDRCADLKAHRLDAWQVLHWTDPEEEQRRKAEATATMMKMVRYGNPY